MAVINIKTEQNISCIKKKNRTHKKATGTNKINAAMLQTTRSMHENVSTHQQWTL